MYMGNKIFVLLFLLLINCNKHSEKANIDKNKYYENHIFFSGFENYKIDKITFEDINNEQLKVYYRNEMNDSHFKLDSISTNYINKGCYIVINDKLRYKITDVMSEEIERYGNFGSVGFFIELEEYKLNDSLIKANQLITIYK